MTERYQYETITTDGDGNFNLGQFQHEIATLYAQIYDDPPKNPEENIYFDLRRYWSAVVIVLNDGNVIGFGSLTLDGDSATLCTSFVKEPHRRKGIYKKIIKIREQIATEQGGTTIEIETLDDIQAPYLLENGYHRIEDNIYKKKL